MLRCQCPSVCPSVCDVCALWSQGGISLRAWMSLLLTNNASCGSSDGMMPGFLVEEGRGMENLVIVAISLNLLTESLLDGWTGNSNDGFVYMLTFIGFFNLMLYI